MNRKALEMAALYAAGALPPDEAARLERQIASGEFPEIAELTSMRNAAALLAHSITPVAPPAGLRDRLMRRIQPTESEPIPGVYVKRAADSGWKQTPYPGVTYKTLHFDEKTSMATSLLKLEPGAVYPPHRHHEAEQCLVIEGEARISDVVIRPGDYERADADTRHGAIETSTGCVLLIISSTLDEMLA